MFTGIIESTGKVISLKKNGSNLKIGIESSIAKELKIGQSIAHNGVCLTVESKGQGIGDKEKYTVIAVKETLDKTNMALVKKGSIVNLERSLKIGDRLDGHFVQGHVDGVATVARIALKGDLREITFHIPRELRKFVARKGSITLNGVALTVAWVKGGEGTVALMPYTLAHTNLSALNKGDCVNIEVDLIARYLAKAKG